MLSFFFRELQLITVLILICDSYMRWSTKFVALKLCVPFSIPFRFFMDYLTLKRHNSFEN